MLLWMAAAALAAREVPDGAATVVEQWGQWEGSWKSQLSGNPFDLELFIDFKLASASSTVTVRGFYDGDNFKARFMPPAVGSWRFETRCSLVKELDGRTGTFSVTASANRGPVTTTAGSTKLRHADGSSHMSIGTTVYGLAGLNDTHRNQTLYTLHHSPFNKVRVMAFPGSFQAKTTKTLAPYLFTGNASAPVWDLTRFDVVWWSRFDDLIKSLMQIGVQADVILFNPYEASYPAGLACLGGLDSSSYNTSADIRFIRYIVARISSFQNVWWSMSNEWNQISCKWKAPAHTPPITKSAPAPYPTPVWDALFRTVAKEDPYKHMTSIHNNAFLYNYSQPWITHFSVQHTHNQPGALWAMYGRKPFVWDEVKYEGNNNNNWGSLSAPQMMHRFWWAAAAGAYAGHGEVLSVDDCLFEGKRVSWSGGGGVLCGESPKRIEWFRQYITNTSLHPPFEECEGHDDGHVQTLSKEGVFYLFRFYHGHPFCNSSFQTVYLPPGKFRQAFVDPWGMRITNIWPPLTVARPAANATDADAAAPVATGITVDEDTLPHILTFTKIPYPQ